MEVEPALESRERERGHLCQPPRADVPGPPQGQCYYTLSGNHMGADQHGAHAQDGIALQISPTGKLLLHEGLQHCLPSTMTYESADMLLSSAPDLVKNWLND